MRRIVVTGVSRGLGRALAEAFVAGGHVVFGCARSARALEDLQRDPGPPHLFRAVDVARDADVASFAREVLALGDAPDLVINNAGLVNAPAPLWEVPAEDLQRVLETNLMGIAHVVRHFAPAMVAAGRGLFVNMSSGWGRSVDAGVAPYCASKWGLEGLTAALALDLPAGVGALALSPGVIDTEMLRVAFGEEAASYEDPRTWARRAAPFILGLDASRSGESLSVP